MLVRIDGNLGDALKSNDTSVGMWSGSSGLVGRLPAGGMQWW